MEVIMQTVRFQRLDKSNYARFKERLIGLYLHAFTTGKFAQSLTPEAVETTLDGIMYVYDGFGNMVFEGDHVIGLLTAFPLTREPDFPGEECPDFPITEAVYIAEVMVHSGYRGRGIASQMIENLEQEAAREYSYAVIRVWLKNQPALELYKKRGFVTIARVSQIKSDISGKEFEMEKVYLYKQLKFDN